MFISERSEVLVLGYGFLSDAIIEESNDTFSAIVAKHLGKPIDVLFRNVQKEYGELAKKNPIARYNWERLYLNAPQLHLA